MTDINNVTIVGRLTKDAELKYTANGAAITMLSVANGYSRKQGEQWIDEVNYFDVKLYGRRGESLNQYLQKGTQIAISGNLRQERWEHDGQKRSKVVINANDIQLLSSKNNSSNSQQQAPQGNNQGYQSTNSQPNFETDEIPF